MTRVKPSMNPTAANPDSASGLARDGPSGHRFVGRDGKLASASLIVAVAAIGSVREAVAVFVDLSEIPASSA